MATMTLLEMTQNILSAMSSDEVNSISDTVESLQVAEEIRNTYFDMVSARDLSHNKGLISLEPTGPVTPHIMTIPDNVVAVEWIKYKNTRTDNLTFNDVTYLPPEDFIKRFVESPPSSSGAFVEVELMPSSPLVFPIPNNKSPEYYTIFDQNKQLIFDSYDADDGVSLLGSRAVAWGTIVQEFILEDDFVPRIPTHMFAHFLAEAKSACFVNYKEVSSAVEERRSRRNLVRLQPILDATQDQDKGWADAVNYGRKR